MSGLRIARPRGLDAALARLSAWWDGLSMRERVLVGTMAALLAAVVLNYLIPEQVFVLIASLAAFATVWVWLMILLSHFAMRRGLSAEERSQIAFPIPFWPVAPLLTLLFMGLVIAVLGMFAETRMALIAGLVWLGLLTVVWYARVRKTALQVVTEQ